MLKKLEVPYPGFSPVSVMCQEQVHQEITVYSSVRHKDRFFCHVAIVRMTRFALQLSCLVEISAWMTATITMLNQEMRELIIFNQKDEIFGKKTRYLERRLLLQHLDMYHIRNICHIRHSFRDIVTCLENFLTGLWQRSLIVMEPVYRVQNSAPLLRPVLVDHSI